MKAANSYSILIILIFCFNYHAAHATDMYIEQPDEGLGVVVPCTQEAHCTVFGTKNVTCSEEGYCECNGTKFCSYTTQIKLNKLEESCRSDVECHVEHSVCKEGKCRCEKGWAANIDNRNCVPMETPQQNCSNCTTINTCTGGRCFCGEEFVPNTASTQCLEIAKTIPGPCQEDVQCSKTFVNALCINEICQCRASYSFNSTSQTCVESFQTETQCHRDEDCQRNTDESGSSGRRCVSGQCKCEPGFVEENGLCTSTIEPCIEPLCSGFNDKVPCIPGRCECPEERQFCTNSVNAEPKPLYYREDNRRRDSGQRRKHNFGQDDDKEADETLKSFQSHHKNFHEGYAHFMIQNEFTIIYIGEIVLLLIGSFSCYVVIYEDPDPFKEYSRYVYTLNFYLIFLCVFVILGLYDLVVTLTTYVTIPLLIILAVYCVGLLCHKYIMPDFSLFLFCWYHKEQTPHIRNALPNPPATRQATPPAISPPTPPVLPITPPRAPLALPGSANSADQVVSPPRGRGRGGRKSKGRRR